MAMEPSENIDPTLGEGVFIAASADVSADVIGRVKLGEQANAWYNATLREDINDLVIGDFSKVQAGAGLTFIVNLSMRKG